MLQFLPIVIIYILNTTCTAISLALSVRAANRRQVLAYSGDEAAAKRIILPCFKPLFRGLIVFYAAVSVALCFTFTYTGVWHHDYRIIQYINFCFIAVHAITPVLLIQTSISIAAFRMTFYMLVPWWSLCTLLWGLSFIEGPSSVYLRASFVLLTSLAPIILSVLILGKFIKSRVQLGSFSNRNSIEFLLLYSLLYGVLYSVVVFGGYGSQVKYIVSWIITIFSIVSCQLFPFVLYRTLLADTKFWRGLGRHNQGGIKVHDDLRESGVDVFRPTMDLNIASSTFQNMMTDIGSSTIDFAYLQLEKVVGHGATSEVYLGRYKKRPVAIKLSNPPEITEEAIEVFVAEAKIASSLHHFNIVEFVGICVRPPQIAMVFEFCEFGNLKSSLTQSPELWTPLKRIRACIDSCRAIKVLHEHKFIHRDLKAENFFVGAGQVVKLGDFGESTKFRSRESTKTKRMTILGTVAFMAPELIAAGRHYTEAIDIYALAVTLWEIWTGQDPYGEISQFDIYEKVAQGYRPGLPTDSPKGFNDIVVNAWQEDASKRPSAAELLIQLEGLMHNIFPALDIKALDQAVAEATRSQSNTTSNDGGNSRNSSFGRPSNMFGGGSSSSSSNSNNTNSSVDSSISHAKDTVPVGSASVNPILMQSSSNPVSINTTATIGGRLSRVASAATRDSKDSDGGETGISTTSSTSNTPTHPNDIEMATVSK